MERRNFLGLTVGLAAAPATAALALQAAAPDDVAAVMQRLITWYKAFGNPRTDPAYYRTFMTDDYLLLEHGELLDLAADMKMLASLPPDHKRTDRFDFRHVRIDGDQAYAVYYLHSEMSDSVKGQRSRQWLESAVARRVGGEWRFAVLHSTRVEPEQSA